MAIRAVVWGENIHDRENAVVRGIYPKGMHGAIADALNEDPASRRRTATLEQPEHGLSEARLAETDVLTWWGHRGHGGVDDEIVERVAERVWQGMGLIVLHSGHFSKIFKKLMGTPCALKWREAGEKERVWVINRNHPIAPGSTPFRRPADRDVRRALPGARADGDGVHQLVRRRRGVPLRPYLPARRRTRSSISRRVTRSTRSTTTRTSGRCSGTRSNGPTTRPGLEHRVAGQNVPTEKAPGTAWFSAAPASTLPAKPDSGESRASPYPRNGRHGQGACPCALPTSRMSGSLRR